MATGTTAGKTAGNCGVAPKIGWGLLRIRIGQMQTAIDQAQHVAEDLRWRAENDPTGDGEPADPEAEMLKRWMNDPRAKFAATLQGVANRRAEERASRAIQGVVQGVDEKGRHYAALIDPTIG